MPLLHLVMSISSRQTLVLPAQFLLFLKLLVILEQNMPLVMSGKTIYDIGFTSEVIRKHVSIKEAVLPFEKFQGCDVLLGPEIRSTGEVMGVDFDFHVAFAKAQIAAGQKLPVDDDGLLAVKRQFSSA
ncbi:hypothetical protein KFK09_014151 [Dendrobium nobile]|uniref:Uncharacterized protein n=1 Tax=Dendrobium nobile TaxID=94219 RepID=A0A8T3BEW6_DENNO|nr:hypothetical protein KFK09_014151 [Dendrobium nobile]